MWYHLHEIVYIPTQVAHTVSIWLTLSLAFWRYEVLKNGRHQRRKNGRRCHQVINDLWDKQFHSFGILIDYTMFLEWQERCTRTIAMAYIGSVLLCIPSFITFGIQSEPIKNISLTINQTQPPTASYWSSSSAPLQLPEAVIYKVDLNRIAKNHDGIIHKVVSQFSSSSSSCLRRDSKIYWRKSLFLFGL